MTARPRRFAGLIALVAAALAAAGCGGRSAGKPKPPAQALGARVPFGRGALYYAPGVAPAEAGKVGDVLVREKWFGDRPADAQVRCQNRRYELRLCVRPGAEADTPTRLWRTLGGAVSAECFGSSPVDVHLCGDDMATLRVVPFEPIRPDLPVRVTVRPSIGGGSLVARHRNDSAKYLTVVVQLRNPTVNESKSVTPSIPPDGVTEHGWAEGWAYTSGETVTITHAGYEAAELVIP